MTAIDSYSYLVLSCISSPLATVTNALEKILSENDLEDRFNKIEQPVMMGSIYEDHPSPGGTTARKVMLFHPKTTPGRTAFFANLEDGWQTMAFAVSEKLECECLRFTSSAGRDFYPQNSFGLIRSGVPIRTVMVSKEDSGWEYFEDGDPLPIEDPTIYQRRRIRDRLNRNIIVRYARKLGWPIDEDEFWTSHEPAVCFVERSDS